LCPTSSNVEDGGAQYLLKRIGMSRITESEHIKDVLHVQLDSVGDQRGRFREIFRKSWFPQRDWSAVQSNHSESLAGVLRGLHYHHQQVDYWYVMLGRIRAGLVDLRVSSPTYKQVATLDLSEEMGIGIYIPVGVAHGFLALEDAAILYIVDNYYDGDDEYGVFWNDPELKVPWGVNNPVLSKRDKANPLLRDISESQLPR
jgi:dTDP-4-dehydrorhamnose 3,5-epimerase